MIRKTEKKGYTMNVLFTILLFLVFVLSALFTALIGGRIYENITVRSDLNYTGNTAFSYIANEVRQGSRAGPVDAVDVGEIGVLEMKQKIGGSEYVTWIYRKDGTIRELFTDTQSGLRLEGGLGILERGGLELKESEPPLHIEALGKGGDAISPSLRSEGFKTDE